MKPAHAAAARPVAAALLVAALLSGCGGPSPEGGPTTRAGTARRAASGLVDIARFEDLQVRFAQDLARPRLVLLLSPT